MFESSPNGGYARLATRVRKLEAAPGWAVGIFARLAGARSATLARLPSTNQTIEGPVEGKGKGPVRRNRCEKGSVEGPPLTPQSLPKG